MRQKLDDITTETAEEGIGRWNDPLLGEDDEFDPGLLLGLNNIVPLLPAIPGYHVAWAPIATEMINDPTRWLTMYRAGYRPITAEDFLRHGQPIVHEAYKDKDNSEFHGCVRVKDVIAVKIPQSRYDRITRHMQEQVLRTEDDMKRRPPRQFENVKYGNIEVDHTYKSGDTHSLQSAFDRI